MEELCGVVWTGGVKMIKPINVDGGRDEGTGSEWNDEVACTI